MRDTAIGPGMTTGAGQQRRGRKIAMTKAELDDFLVGRRICRVATVGSRGPHLTALWYVWDGTAMWLTSVVRCRRHAPRRSARVA
jgi:nitroimidazol reductase NimA-like FMN-containing flavoprotein (pyridoxamine 5'-phosphate oxidase superfamily)